MHTQHAWAHQESSTCTHAKKDEGRWGREGERGRGEKREGEEGDNTESEREEGREWQREEESLVHLR